MTLPSHELDDAEKHRIQARSTLSLALSLSLSLCLLLTFIGMLSYETCRCAAVSEMNFGRLGCMLLDGQGKCPWTSRSPKMSMDILHIYI